jgi:glycosyltransferase involved in cell wall biosynthesis
LKISVITVCFNSEKTIGYTLESFFSQTHIEKEIVIIDGVSTDRTLDIVRSFPQQNIIIISEPDRGMYDAANKGLRLFTGAAVGFLNSDDRFHDATVLSNIADVLEKFDMVSANLDFVRDHDTREVLREWRGSPYKQGAFRRGWMPAHPTFYVRRYVAEIVGFFDSRFKIAADYDWMLRAHELHSFHSTHLKRVVVDMKVGGKSTSDLSSWIQHNIEALHSRRRWLGSGLVDYALFAKPIQKLPQFRRTRT